MSGPDFADLPRDEKRRLSDADSVVSAYEKVEQERRANAYPKLVEALKQARAAAGSAYLRGADIANNEKRGSRAALAGDEMRRYAESAQADVDALLRELGEAS